MQAFLSQLSLAKEDSLGMILSMLCLVHCFGMAIAMALMPVVSAEDTEHSHIHLWFALGVVVIGVLAFARGYCAHKRLDVVLCGLAGVALLIVGLFIEEYSVLGSTAITIIGSVVLVTSHFRNSRLGNKCRSCCSNS